MDKAQVIASVAGDLDATERSVDEAIVRATSLVQSMIEGRTALSISPIVGTEAQAQAMEALASLSSARQAMVACHHELAKDHRRMGYGAYAEGGMDKGKNEKPPTTGERLLRAV